MPGGCGGGTPAPARASLGAVRPRLLLRIPGQGEGEAPPVLCGAVPVPRGLCWVLSRDQSRANGSGQLSSPGSQPCPRSADTCAGSEVRHRQWVGPWGSQGVQGAGYGPACQPAPLPGVLPLLFHLPGERGRGGPSPGGLSKEVAEGALGSPAGVEGCCWGAGAPSQHLWFYSRADSHLCRARSRSPSSTGTRCHRHRALAPLPMAGVEGARARGLVCRKPLKKTNACYYLL